MYIQCQTTTPPVDTSLSESFGTFVTDIYTNAGKSAVS